MRQVAGIVLVLLLSGAPFAAAGSFLYVAGEPGDRFLEGAQVYLDASNAVFEPQLRSHPAGFLVTVYAGEHWWNIWMEVPEGQPLVPGPYGSAVGALVDSGYFPSEPPAPHLAIDGPPGCAWDTEATLRSTGRFVIRHVIPYAPYLVEVVADFEQRCAGATGTIRGTIAFEASSLFCTLNPNGTPCDDFDPCTQNDACSAGMCAGEDAVSPTCTASDACHDAGVCDRQLGTCVAPVKPGETPCDDGNACTVDDRCAAGACSGAARDCDDDHICTEDTCDPAAGCEHAPAPGSCWVFRPTAKAVAIATSSQGSVRCTARCQAADPLTLLLAPDGTYRMHGDTTALCLGEQITVADETGTIRRRNRRLLLAPDNADEMRETLRRCIGVKVPRNGYRQWVREQDEALVGRSTLRGHARRDGANVSVSVKQRIAAVPGLDANGVPVDPPASIPGLPSCDGYVPTHCVER